MDAVELEVMAEIDMAVETVGTAEEDIWSDVKDAIVNKKERERLYVRVYVCISCRTVFIKDVREDVYVCCFVYMLLGDHCTNMAKLKQSVP